MSMGLTQEQYLDVSTWTTPIHLTRTRTDMHDFPGEKALVSSYGGQVAAGATRMQTFEADDAALPGVMENTLPMVSNLQDLGNSAPAMHAPAKLISDANPILPAQPHPSRPTPTPGCA